MNPFKLAALALAFLMLTTAQAFAAEVDIRPLIDLGIQIVGACILAAVGVLVPYALRKFKLDIDAGHRDAIEKALAAAVNYGIQKAGALSNKVDPIEVKNEAVAAAASYAVSKVPDALKHFDITPEKLAEMIRARLPADKQA